MSDLKFTTAGDYMSDSHDRFNTTEITKSDNAMIEQLRNWSDANSRLAQIADRFEALVEKAVRHEVLLKKVEKYSAQFKQAESE